MSGNSRLVVDRDAFFRDSKAFLSRGTHAGDNVFDHVAALLLKIAEEKPADGLEAFERYSFYAKEDALKKRINPESKQLPHQDQPLWDANLAQAKNLFRTSEEIIEDLKAAMPPVGEDEEVEEPELPEPNDGFLPDVVGEQRLLESAGTGFGPEETYRLTLSIKALLEGAPLEHVRLWGKIMGVHADYYVVESKFKDGEAPEDPEDAQANEEEEEEANAGNGEEEEEDELNQDLGEEGGLGVRPVGVRRIKPHPAVPKEKNEGINRLTYWVCTQIGGAWTRLPNVTPQQITAARKIKRFFTGDLAHEVNSYPPFPGNEAAYLRAQIARITHATSISPKGYFNPDENADEGSHDIVKNDEYEAPELEELIDPENWVHHEPKILLQGRVKHWAPEEPEEEEEDNEEDPDKWRPPKQPLPRELQPEDQPAILSGITEDEALIPEVIPAWSARLCSTHLKQYSVAAVYSNIWPGFTAVAQGKTFASLYVGYGHKYAAEPMTPFPLPQVQSEPKEEVEAEEPPLEEEIMRFKKDQKKNQEDNEDEEDGEEEEED